MRLVALIVLEGDYFARPFSQISGKEMDGTDLIWLKGVLDKYDIMLATASADNGNLGQDGSGDLFFLKRTKQGCAMLA